MHRLPCSNLKVMQSSILNRRGRTTVGRCIVEGEGRAVLMKVSKTA